MPNSTIAVLGECGVTQVKTKSAKGQLLVQNTVISFTRIQQGDFISLTDIAKVKNADEPKDVVKNWLRSRSTIDFLGLWEQINNPNFKGVEFDSFRSQVGTNSFTLSPSKWIEATGAIGIRSTAGRTGGTYAHQDIAFEFASWVSAEFKLRCRFAAHASDGRVRQIQKNGRAHH